MRDEERLAWTAALLRRRRAAARLSWSFVALCAGTVLVASVLATFARVGDTPATVATVAGWAGFLALLPSPVLTRDMRRFEAELATLRRAAVRRWPPELTGVLEIQWESESRGRLYWNALPVGAVLHRPGMVRVTRLTARIRAGGVWFREVVPGLMPWVRLRVDDHRYLMTRRKVLVDEVGRAYSLPELRSLRSAEPVSVELPGELGPMGAIALLGLATYPRDRAETTTDRETPMSPVSMMEPPAA